jgi:hypothetical protein
MNEKKKLLTVFFRASTLTLGEFRRKKKGRIFANLTDAAE